MVVCRSSAVRNLIDNVQSPHAMFYHKFCVLKNRMVLIIAESAVQWATRRKTESWTMYARGSS